MSVLYDIVRVYRMLCRYYTISHVYIYKNVRQHHSDDVARNIVIYDVTYGIACLGLRLRRACPWSAHRPCPMILGPAGWSVLHRHSPDALSLSLACATANVSGGSLVTSKNRNFKL